MIVINKMNNMEIGITPISEYLFFEYTNMISFNV